jgi:hypothetical protein
MRDQVEAIQCGHWTEVNEDGSVPLRCDYCFLDGAKDFRERIDNGTMTLPPETIDGLGKAMECRGMEGETLKEFKERLRQLGEPEDD